MLLSLPKINKPQWFAIIGLSIAVNLSLIALLNNLIAPSSFTPKTAYSAIYLQSASATKELPKPETVKPLVASTAPSSAPRQPAMVDFALPKLDSLVTLPDVVFTPDKSVDITPSLSFEFSAQGIQQGSQFQARTAMAKPTYQIPPKYPAKAKRNGIEGYIVLSLLINQQGEVEQHKVVDESPRGVFLRSSLRSVMRWKFVPPQSGEQWQQITLNYNLEN